MSKWKIQINGYERNTKSEIAVARNYIVDAETKEEAQQKAKIIFISAKGGNFRLRKDKPIQYTRKNKCINRAGVVTPAETYKSCISWRE